MWFIENLNLALWHQWKPHFHPMLQLPWHLFIKLFNSFVCFVGMNCFPDMLKTYKEWTSSKILFLKGAKGILVHEGKIKHGNKEDTNLFLHVFYYVFFKHHKNNAYCLCSWHKTWIYSENLNCDLEEKNIWRVKIWARASLF